MSKVSGMLIAALTIAAAGCSNGVPLGPSTPPSSSSSSTTPPSSTSTSTGPTSTAGTSTPTAIAYNQDLQPVFNSDCVPCHGGSRPAARYSMTTYAGVMAAVRAGSASSALVLVTQPGGMMYPFLTGDRTAKSAMIRTWVLNGAPQSR